MEAMGFSDEEMMNLYTIVAAVLHLGNVEFLPQERSVGVKNIAVLKDVASFLGVDCAALAHVSTTTARTWHFGNGC